MKYFETQGENNITLLTIIIIMVLLVVAATVYQIHRVGDLERELSIEKAALETVTAMVARDDVLMDLFLEHPWVRDKKVHHRWYLNSRGETVNAFTQYPDPDVTYQLSY